MFLEQFSKHLLFFCCSGLVGTTASCLQSGVWLSFRGSSSNFSSSLMPYCSSLDITKIYLVTFKLRFPISVKFVWKDVWRKLRLLCLKTLSRNVDENIFSHFVRVRMLIAKFDGTSNCWIVCVLSAVQSYCL